MRKLLDKIINANSGYNWWKLDLFIKNTLNILPREIKILKNPPKKENNYNCFMYALGLDDNKVIKKSCGGFIYDTFFQKLLDERLLKYTDSPQKGDYIIYRDLKNNPNIINHIGVVDEKGVVISKWSWGPLLKHKIFDIPKSYGSDIAYVKAMSKKRVAGLYEKYKKFNTK